MSLAHLLGSKEGDHYFLSIWNKELALLQLSIFFILCDENRPLDNENFVTTFASKVCKAEIWSESYLDPAIATSGQQLGKTSQVLSVCEK